MGSFWHSDAHCEICAPQEMRLQAHRCTKHMDAIILKSAPTPASPPAPVARPAASAVAAFPGGGERFPQHAGMSLRDYFAAKAMHAELVTAGAFDAPAEALAKAADEAGMTIEERVAYNAYRIADAMLRESRHE